ncbi:MAG: hypothetical protein JO166_08315 [Deltaproteobacteria bacterium]|nr:hypothetical protein [Deltaproteobacteria bacterium]
MLTDDDRTSSAWKRLWEEVRPRRPAHAVESAALAEYAFLRQTKGAAAARAAFPVAAEHIALDCRICNAELSHLLLAVQRMEVRLSATGSSEVALPLRLTEVESQIVEHLTRGQPASQNADPPLTSDEAVQGHVANIPTKPGRESLSLSTSWAGPNRGRYSILADGGTSTPAVQVFSLGGFQAFVHGHVLDDWRRAGARQLFKWLLTRPDRELGRAEVGRYFRPHSDTATAASYVRSVSQALRQTLQSALEAPRAEVGHEFVFIDRDTISLRQDRELWLDADAFEQLIQQARSVPNPLPLLEQAESLYAGDYLPGDLDKDWATARRERLKRLHMQLQMSLGRGPFAGLAPAEPRQPSIENTNPWLPTILEVARLADRGYNKSQIAMLTALPEVAVETVLQRMEHIGDLEELARLAAHEHPA